MTETFFEQPILNSSYEYLVAIGSWMTMGNRRTGSASQDDALI